MTGFLLDMFHRSRVEALVTGEELVVVVGVWVEEVPRSC